MKNNEERLEILSRDIEGLLQEVELLPLAHGKGKKGYNSYLDVAKNLIAGAAGRCDFYRMKGDAQYLDTAEKVVEVVRLYFSILEKNPEYFDKEYEEPPKGESEIPRAFPDLYDETSGRAKTKYVIESAKRLGEIVDESLSEGL